MKIRLAAFTSAILLGLAAVQKNAARYRAWMLVNSVLRIIYDVSAGVFINIFTHGFIDVSVMIAMVRLNFMREI